MSELERALRELGRELDWPAQPSLAAAVAARLERPRSNRRPLALALAAVAAALAVALAVPPARSAILDFFGVGGVEIRRVETLPPLPAERAAPGVPMALAQARNRVDFDLVVPEGHRRVYWAPGIVTFVWPDRLLMQFQGDVFEKGLQDETDVVAVDVHGHQGVWIDGAPHGLVLPGGERRLAGNVLIWVADGVTFRLEGELTLRRALRLAGTLTPRGT